jgi:hypothetical protein
MFTSTGCSAMPTTVTTIEDFGACSLQPIYNDSAAMSDLSTWLAGFPTMLALDFVYFGGTANATFTSTITNATMMQTVAESAEEYTWPAQTFPDINTTETASAGTTILTESPISTITPNPSAVTTLTEILTSPVSTEHVVTSEVLVIYNTTSVVSSGTAEATRRLTSTIVDQTISTVTPSATTTLTSLETSVVSGQNVVISEVLVAYNATYVTTSGSTDFDGGVTKTTIDQTISTLTPSEFETTISTDKFNFVWSDSIEVIGETTVIVKETIISAIGGSPISPVIVSTVSSSTASFSTSLRPTPTKFAGSTSCEVFVPATPAKKPANILLTCAISSGEVDYDPPFSYDDDVNGTYWLLPEPLSKYNNSYTNLFCEDVTRLGSPYVLGPVGGSVPEGGQQPVQLVYTNSIYRSLTSMDGVTGIREI